MANSKGTRARRARGESSRGTQRPPLQSARYPGHEEVWRLLVLTRLIDDEAPNFLRKNLGWSYHAPAAGHEGIQLALGCTFREGIDYLFPYYRDLCTVLAAGITPSNVSISSAWPFPSTPAIPTISPDRLSTSDSSGSGTFQPLSARTRTVPPVPTTTKPHLGCGWSVQGSLKVPQRVSNFERPQS